jgi:carbon monoxide dehydrogenase subunit G
MPVGAGIAWELLQNIEAVAGCMPGAAITERTDPKHYQGTVSVRFGPATMSFRGEVELTDIDAGSRTLRLLGNGVDSTGTSGASMDLTARIEEAGATSNLVGRSEVSMSGKAAAFGGRMIGAVADQVLKQFAANFATQVAALAASRPPGAALPGAPPPQGDADRSTAQPAAPKASGELNGLALMWAIFKDWLRALFGKSPA